MADSRKNNKSSKKGASRKFIVTLDSDKDISNDTPGSGGSRREDGTLSAQYKNPIPYDEDQENADKAELEQLRQEKLNRELSDYDNNYSYPTEQHDALDMISDATEALANLTQVLADNPWIVEGVVKGAKWVHGKLKLGISKITGISEKKPKAVIDAELVEDENTDIAKTPEKPLMSVEEARVRLVRMVNSYLNFLRDYNALKNSTIVDPETGETVKLNVDDGLNKLQEFVKANPALINDFQTYKQISNLSFEGITESERKQVMGLLSDTDKDDR